MLRSFFYWVFGLAVMAADLYGQEPLPAVDPFGNTMKPRTFNTSFFEPYNSLLKDIPTQSKVTHPEFGRLPYNAPDGSTEEILERRTANTRTFRSQNGELLYQQGYQPLHFKNEKGEWVSIDERLHPDPSHPGIFSAPYQTSPTLINLIQGFTEIKRQGSVFRFNQVELFHVTNQGKRTSLGKARWDQYSAGSDGVYISNAWPGIDMQILFSAGAIKTNYLVQSATNYTEGYLVFSDQTSHSDHTVSYDRQMGMPFHGDVQWTGVQGPEFTYSKAFGYDQTMSTASMMKFDYTVMSGGIVEMCVPVSWLKNQNLQFPLVIDPLVTSSATTPQASIAGSYHQGTGLFTLPCTYTMNVPTPTNCTITNVLWSFNYIAQNGAALCYGAVDLVVNGCRSPANPSFYWFCNNCMFAGTCTGNNISIFADVSTCVPAPQCPSYNLPCTLNFYARAVPITGCSNFYIGANSNWTMTLQGRTVEQTAAPSSSNGTTICLGTGTQLTATGIYGVPAYSYVWSPGGQTTQSIWVTPTVNTTYTCTITDACGNTATNSVAITVNTSNTLTIPNIYAFMNPPSGNPCPVIVTFCSDEATGNNYGGGAETWQWSFPSGTQLSGGATSGSSNGSQYGGAGADATCSANTPGGTAYTVQYNTAGSYWASFTIFKGGSCAVRNLPIVICGALPIELLEFTAVYTGSVVELNWRTASETNNDFFTVERSLDGVNYSAIGIVDGAGNSSHENRYSLIDDAPPEGVIYYRLKQTDFNADESYSDIRSVLIRGIETGSLLVAPNPASQEVQILFASYMNAVARLKVFEASGRMIHEMKISAKEGYNTYSMDVSTWIPGVYLLELESGGKTMKTLLIKE